MARHLATRAIFRHRPSRPRPRASHKRGPPTFLSLCVIKKFMVKISSFVLTSGNFGKSLSIKSRWMWVAHFWMHFVKACLISYTHWIDVPSKIYWLLKYSILSRGSISPWHYFEFKSPELRYHGGVYWYLNSSWDILSTAKQSKEPAKSTCWKKGVSGNLDFFTLDQNLSLR